MPLLLEHCWQKTPAPQAVKPLTIGGRAKAAFAAAILCGNTLPSLASGLLCHWSSYSTHTMACTSGKNGWEYTAYQQQQEEANKPGAELTNTQAHRG